MGKLSSTEGLELARGQAPSATEEPCGSDHARDTLWLHLRPSLFLENFLVFWGVVGDGVVVLEGVHIFSVKHKSSAPSTVQLQHCCSDLLKGSLESKGYSFSRL